MKWLMRLPTLGLEELAHFVDHHQVTLIPRLLAEFAPPG